MNWLESKESLINQLLSLQGLLKLSDEALLWHEVVEKIGYDAEDNYILAKALYLLSDEKTLYDYQEIDSLIETVKNINC